MKKLLLLFLIFFCSSAFAGTWSNLGDVGGAWNIQAMAVYDDNLFTADGGGILGTYNSTSNVWSSLGDVSATNISAMAVYNGNLYTGDTDGKLGMYDGSTWTEVVDTSLGIRDFAVHDGNLFMSNDGNIGTYNSGSDTWTLVVDSTTIYYIYSLEVYDGNIFTGDSTGILGTYNNTTKLWNAIEEYGSWTHDMIVYDGKLYTGHANGYLRVYDGSSYSSIDDTGGVIRFFAVYDANLYMGISASGDYLGTYNSSSNEWNGVTTALTITPSNLFVYDGNLFTGGGDGILGTYYVDTSLSLTGDLSVTNLLQGGADVNASFSVSDFDTNASAFTVDANLSTVPAVGQGEYVIFADFNLAIDFNAFGGQDTNNLGLGFDVNFIFPYILPSVDANYYFCVNLKNTEDDTNFGSCSSVSILIDSIKPTTSWDGNHNTPQITDANIALACVDGGSECSTTSYRLDTDSATAITYGAWQTYSPSAGIIVSSDGNWAIDFNSTDNAGNVGDTNTFYVIIDKTYVTTVITSKFNYFDLNADGTNFGEVSESWEAEEAKSKFLTTQYNDVNQLLIIRKLNNNATLTVTVNGSTIGTIDANAIGDNTYYTYVFDIRDVYLNTTNLQTVLFTASAAQDTTYMSFVGFMNKTPTDLNILAGGEAISTLFNLTAPSGYDSVYTDVNTGDWNAHTAQIVHGDLSPTYGFFGYARFIGIGLDTNGFIHNRLVTGGTDYNSSDTSFEIDSTFPEILATGYDVNVVKNRTHIFWAHVKDANNHNNYGLIDIETVEYVMTRTDFNLSDTNYSRSVSFAGTGSYSIRFITADQAQNKTLGSYFNVLSSEISRSIGSYSLHPSFSRNDVDVEITDAFQSIPITWVVPFSFTVTGLGTIDYYTHDYNITDSNIVDTNYGKSDGTVVIKGDTNNLTGSLVGIYTAPTTFDENAIYTVPYSVESEWENAGGANRRLFYVNYRSGSKTLPTVWLAIPLRTPFNPDTSLIQLRRCTEGINWGSKTCTTWENIGIYSEGNPYNGGTYPTQDTNTNSLKDTLFMVIPSMASGEEEMFDVDVIAGYETAWGLGGSIGQGGGGGGVQDEIEELIEEILEAPLEATGALFANFVTGFFGLFSGGIESFTSLDLSGENMFFLIGLIVIILIGFWALTPSAQPVKITRRAATKGFGL